jgi:glycosyltransferase involved in cell wall biosynthesis
MRVAIVGEPYVPVPPPKYGGTEQVIHYLIKGLLELGHEPVLLAPGDSNVPCELIPTVNKAVYFPKTKADATAHARTVKTILKSTEALVRKIAPHVDVVHSHGFDMRHFPDIPNVTTLHGPFTFDSIDYYEKRRHLNYVSISKNQQEAFPVLNYVGVVHNGEDPADFPIVTQPENYVCFIGRFDNDKNPHLAILLAIKMGIHIKVAGKIDHLGDGYFQNEVEPYLSHPLVEYIGEVDFEEKVEILSKARANLHPTGFREPFGLTVIEAGYCGTPTLAINKGSMPELIKDGINGIVVEDFIEGYHKLHKCFSMDRAKVAHHFRSQFNYKRMAAGYARAYEKVLETVPKKMMFPYLRMPRLKTDSQLA